MKPKKHPHYWVIRSMKKSGRTLFGGTSYIYFAKRAGIKNPRFATCLHWDVKWFATKEDAWEFYYRKSNAGHDLSNYYPVRKKLFLDKTGKYDYWRNRTNLLKR